jgi:hypothetical protein
VSFEKPSSQALSDHVSSVAKDLSWFANDYIRFPSCLESPCCIGGKPEKVIGVGTVNLGVKLDPKSQGILRLKNVLQIPTMPCNIVGDLRDQGYEMSFNKIVDIWTQKTVAYLAIK